MVQAILGWIIAIGVIISLYHGCTGKDLSFEWALPEATVLDSALAVPPRPVWFVREQDCAFHDVLSWAAVERGIRRQQGSFHVVEVGTKGFSIKFDETKKYAVFTFTEEDCEKARTTLKPQGAWVAKE